MHLSGLQELEYVEDMPVAKDCFEDFPPELILLLPPLPTNASLNALVLTCHRLRGALQPELESRLIPEIAPAILISAAKSNPVIVAKLLAPPHSLHPDEMYGWGASNALHVAVQSGNRETAMLLLAAGAEPDTFFNVDEHRPLHLAAMKNDVEMVELLLDHGAMYGDARSMERANALHYASRVGNLELVKCLVERGARIDVWSDSYGTPLGHAIRFRHLDVVRFLLDSGADTRAVATVYCHPSTFHADALYIFMGLRTTPRGAFFEFLRNLQVESQRKKWVGLPLTKETKDLMAMFLAHDRGSKDVAMQTIRQHLPTLAVEALYTEEEYLEVIAGMFLEAEDALADALHSSK
ncbi:ankyrin repeat-containing domain protein [Mycena polygramma]|nr:ankyrin repeat-containing domain protein [Mycena polygramma]